MEMAKYDIHRLFLLHWPKAETGLLLHQEVLQLAGSLLGCWKINRDSQIWWIVDMKCAMVKSEIPSLRMDQFLASILSSSHVMARPPTRKFRTHLLQILDQRRKLSIVSIAATTCPELCQSPLCDSLPIQEAATQFAIGKNEAQ